MSVISKRIQEAEDRIEVRMTVPEWDNVELLLISPTVQERLDMIEAYTEWSEDVDGDRIANLNAAAMAPAIVIACAYDPDTRERAFEDGDLAWLKEKNGAVVQRVADECLPLVGFGQSGATESGKDDSSTTPSAATGSDSPGSSDAP